MWPSLRTIAPLFFILAGAALLAADTARTFDIPAGDARQTLKQFAQQAGRDIVYPSLDAQATNPVRGHLTIREALDQLLRGTGLVAFEDGATGGLVVRRSGSPKPLGAVNGDRPSVDRTAVPAPRAPTLPPPEAAIVELNPFIVQTDQDVGYLAANTLAGSRLNSALKDTAASISVFTSEFMADLGAYELSEVARYAVNVEYQLDDDRATAPNGNETVSGYQTFRVRGLRASVGQNYFRWNLPMETALLERIEDSRGPNSVLFGIASPGGLLNSSTKQARTGRNFRQASLGAGSFDSWRSTLDLNQVLPGGRAAVRLNTVFNRTNSFRHWQFQESKIAHLAARYRHSASTEARIELQHGQIDSNQPRSDNLLNNGFLVWVESGRPTNATQTASAAQGTTRLATALTTPHVTYISNNRSIMAERGTLTTVTTGPLGTGTVLDRRYTDPRINVGGPAQDRSSRFHALSAFVEHRLLRHAFLEAAYNHQDHVFDRYDPQVDTPQRLRGDPNQRLNDGAPNPFAGQLYLEGGWQRHLNREVSDTGRLMFSTEHDAASWGHYRLAALGEYERSFVGTASYREMWVDAATGLAAFNSAPENTANVAYRRTYPIERDWATYQLNGPGRGGLFDRVYDPITARTLSSAWFPSGGGVPKETYSTQQGLMLAGQARYFGGRLILAAGLRRDDLDEYQMGRRRDPRTNAWTYARDPAQADPTQPAMRASNVGRNRTAGVVHHLTPWLSVFYNQASNISLPARGQTRLPDSGIPGTPIPIEPPRGRGEDAGLALDLFQGRLFARATYYTTRGQHQSTTSPTPVQDANVRILDALYAARLISAEDRETRLRTGSQDIFDHRSRGLEVQVTANLTSTWRWQATYSSTDAVEENLFPSWRAWHVQNLAFLGRLNTAGVVTSSGRTIAQEVDFYLNTGSGLNEYTENDGGTKLGTRRHKASLFTRYGFTSGWLKGVYVGGGWSYQSRLFTGLDPLRHPAWAPSYWRADAMAGYTMRPWGNTRRLSFQANVYNLTNDRDPLVTRYSWETGQRRIFRTVPQPPTTWRFATTLDF
jgi:iron complex outermembrane receptor protein